MNLLPIQYPNVWLEEDREWFTLGELPYQAPAVYYAFIDFKWDENIGVVFLKPNKDSKTNPFSICLVEFLTYDKNIYIESIQTLGYAEDSVVDFSNNPSPTAKKIDSFTILQQFQYLEKFYVGVISKISDLKPLLFEIADDEWLYNKTIKAF